MQGIRSERVLGLRKKLVMILACFFVIMMAGCSLGGSSDGTSEDESGKKSKKTEKSVTESNSDDESLSAPQIPSEELYEGFLAGDERVYCDNREYVFYDSVAGKDIKLFTNKEGYTLKEFVNEIQGTFDLEPDGDVRVSGVNWVMLDCGDDGEPELGLEILSESSILGLGEDYQFVIKNIDGKLQICYRMASAAKSKEILVNRYGFTKENYYGGTGARYSYGWLDSNVNYHFLYCVREDSLNAEYGVDGGDGYGIADIAKRISEREGDEYLFLDFDVLEYRLKEYEEGEDASQVYKYSYIYYGEKDALDEGLMSLFEEVFSTAGVKIYSQEEIEEFLSQRIKECGTDKAIYGFDTSHSWKQMDREEY